MENKQDKGFTLVELLIVIVILGILATVTVFAVRGITDQGQQSSCEATEKTMQVAVESYFAQFGGAAIVSGADALPAGMVSKGYAAGATPEETLVNVELIVETSGTVDVAADGTITATAAEACVGLI